MLELSLDRWQRAEIRVSRQKFYHKPSHGEKKKAELYMFARTMGSLGLQSILPNSGI